MALKQGSHLGPYEILAAIGAGGMGEVYKAKDTRLDRMVAIKVLPEELARNPDSLARFEREAKAVAALNHPNITGIFDIGRVEDTAYAVMELLEGESLRSRLLQGALTNRVGIELAVQMAHGLAAAHDKGVIHRDLKPDNLWITTEGRLKILDFGLAKQMAPASRGSQSYLATEAVSPGHVLHTEEGMILGTMGYMSPEQVRGENVDMRSDIFSFGAVLFEMLTGKKAFARDTASDTMAAILRDDPPGNSASSQPIPPALRRIVDHCLEKVPTHRFHDANDLAFALENLASSSGSNASFMAPFAPQHRKTTGRWAALAIAVGSAVVFGIWTWARLHPSEKPRVTRLSIHLPAGQVLSGIGGPAVSRDGRSIAYVARDAAGVSRLYVRVLDRFEPSLIPESEGADEPFFSPDGNRIGFFARGKLMTAACSGGAAAPIANASFFNFGATWGEDDTIVFVPSLNAGLVRIHASGGKPQQLTEPDDTAKGYAHVWPQFLPGGGSVVFTIWGGLNTETVGTAILSLNSGTPVTGLIPGQGSSAYLRSGHVLKSAGRRGLMAASFNPDHPRTTPVQTFVLDDVFSQPAASCSWFSVSDSGTLVYVPGDRNMSTVAWVDREGRVTPQAEKAASIGDPALSPDGTKVVLVQDEALWLVDVRRGTRSRLTQETERTDAYPVFSRDGTRIYFGSNRGGDWDIYSVPAGGGTSKQVLARTGNQFPLSEAPDGTLLFSDRRKGNSADLWTLSPDGKVSPFIVSPASKVGGQYAPDGRTVAYISDETGRDEIHIRSVVRPDDDAIVSVDGGREPLWSPDGKEIFYRRGDAFMVVSVSTSGPFQVGSARKMFDIQAALGRSTMHPGYGVSPDGKRFLVLLLDPRAIPTQINVVLNWFEELNAKVPPR